MMQWNITISVLELAGALGGAAALAGGAVFVVLWKRIKRLAALASTDELTQLYNSREFKRRLASEVDRVRRYGTALSLVLLDIDGFKRINDTYGYCAGDSVLCDFACLLASRVRAADMIFRYKQGDEFAILAGGTGVGGAKVLTERLLVEIADCKFSIDAEPRGTSFTVSAGVAAFDRSSDTVEAFVRRAEAALGNAKRKTNAVVVEESSQTGLNLGRLISAVTGSKTTPTRMPISTSSTEQSTMFV